MVFLEHPVGGGGGSGGEHASGRGARACQLAGQGIMARQCKPGSRSAAWQARQGKPISRELCLASKRGKLGMPGKSDMAGRGQPVLSSMFLYPFRWIPEFGIFDFGGVHNAPRGRPPPPLQ
eukprot:gene15164-biopygen17157